MAEELNFQAIIDLVGDKLREMFERDNMGIFWLRPAGRSDPLPVRYEHGQRCTCRRMPLGEFATGRRSYDDIRARKTLIWHNRGRVPAPSSSSSSDGTDMSRSGVIVPHLRRRPVARHARSSRTRREGHAFGDADVRLLSTVAASMGVALENARLFDETQRLLKETEQRAAELAVINSIQQGMAAELNFQAIVDLVGDKLRELFNTGDIGIRWLDEKTDLVHQLYVYEHGQRLSLPPTQVQPRVEARPGAAEGRAGPVSGTRRNSTRSASRRTREPTPSLSASSCRSSSATGCIGVALRSRASSARTPTAMRT